MLAATTQPSHANNENVQNVEENIIYFTTQGLFFSSCGCHSSLFDFPNLEKLDYTQGNYWLVISTRWFMINYILKSAHKHHAFKW